MSTSSILIWFSTFIFKKINGFNKISPEANRHHFCLRQISNQMPSPDLSRHCSHSEANRDQVGYINESSVQSKSNGN